MPRSTRFNVMFLPLAIFGVFLLHEAWIASRQVAPIPYSEFQRLLRDKKVKEVVVVGNRVEGEQRDRGRPEDRGRQLRRPRPRFREGGVLHRVGHDHPRALRRPRGQILRRPDGRLRAWSPPGRPIFKKAEKWSEHPVDKAVTSSNEKPETPQSEALQRQENLMQAIQEITDAIIEGASINDVLLMVMETIYRSFSFQRVMFCLIDKTRTSLNARFGFGKDVEVLIQRLSITLGSDKDIFNQALTQSRDMIIEDVMARTRQDYLPKWYRDEYAKKSMLVYPIIVKNVPMGLLYMDSMMPITLADDSHYSLI